MATAIPAPFLVLRRLQQVLLLLFIPKRTIMVLLAAVDRLLDGNNSAQ